MAYSIFQIYIFHQYVCTLGAEPMILVLLASCYNSLAAGTLNNIMTQMNHTANQVSTSTKGSGTQVSASTNGSDTQHWAAAKDCLENNCNYSKWWLVCN